jgi:hypothetical protein
MAASATEWLLIQPIVARMIASKHERVREAGASMACVAALEEEEAQKLADECLIHKDPAVRKGAAAVFSANLSQARFTQLCEEALANLFNDPDEPVREEAAKVFWHMTEGTMGRHIHLGIGFLNSLSFADPHHNFINALEASKDDVTPLTLGLAQKLLEHPSPDLADIRTSGPIEAQALSGLLVRTVASQRRDPRIRAQALDWIDRLLQTGAWGVSEKLDGHR